jgi:OOP family OmpA-OmpF porin
MKKTLLIFLGLFIFTFASYAQDETSSVEKDSTKKASKDFTKWTLEIGGGFANNARAHDGAPGSPRYFDENGNRIISNTTNPFSGFQVNAAVRYNFTNTFGLRFRGAFNNFSADIDNSSFDYNSSYVQTSFEAVINFNHLANFYNWTDRFDFQVYAGLGAGFHLPDSQWNDNGADATANIVFGFAPIWRLTDKVDLKVEGQFMTVHGMENNWSGRTPVFSRSIDGIMYNATVGVNIALGGKESIEWDYTEDAVSKVTLKNKLDELEERLANLENNQPVDNNNNGIDDKLEDYIGDNYLSKEDGDNMINNFYNQFYNKLLEGEKLNIFFGYDEAKPEKGSIADINALIDFMKENSDKSIVLTGYADVNGPESYNEKLSMKRAEFIKDLLLEAGVDESRVDVAAGGENPTYNKKTTYVRMLARRVSVKLK